MQRTSALAGSRANGAVPMSPEKTPTARTPRPATHKAISSGTQARRGASRNRNGTRM